MAAVRAACGEDEDLETIIAVAELLGFVALAAARAAEWRGRVVAYIGDNQNVRSWLRGRAPRCPPARQLVRLLAYLEITAGFQ
eukprot:2567515-Alexandrium_andersonii.AAC.1